MKLLIPIILGGALGSSLRWLLFSWVDSWIDGWLTPEVTRFPVAILMVNILGCFAIGVLSGSLLRHGMLSEPLKAFLFVGFLGAFTTFSTFSYDTIRLIQAGDWVLSLLNVLLSVVLGLLAVLMGLKLVH